MKEKVLLVGNDINNVTAGYSWSNLLDDLIDHSKIPERPSLEDKPFPLLYEEIYLNSAKTFNTREIDLKKYIAQKTQNLIPNDIHVRLMQLGIRDIFTTNYDLTFELVANQKVGDIRNKGVVKENLYSLFRNYETEDHRIWHLHGSQLTPNTITLGYEHYGGYLQLMRNYVISGINKRYKNVKLQSLLSSLRFNNVKHHSWVDHFFTHDLFILGLNLDFVEMHLWWLLTLRTRLMVTNKADIENKIYYFYPQVFEKSSKAKLDLLKINGITTIALPMKKNGRLGYYNKVIDYISSL